MGRQLVKNYLNKEKFVRANVMMDAPDSRTMSKTKGNGINLSDSPEVMYGKAMSYDDDHILIGLELLTDTPLEEIAQIKVALAKGENPMTYKKLMAKRVVEIVYGGKLATESESLFEKTVQNKDIEQDKVLEVRVHDDLTVLDSLKLAVGAKYSSGDIKRMIEQGGVEVNGIKVQSISQKIEINFNTIVKYGKREFFRLVKNG